MTAGNDLDSSRPTKLLVEIDLQPRERVRKMQRGGLALTAPTRASGLVAARDCCDACLKGSP
eukprot:scaffold96282_cov29-Tisochrysis_lutea.AAC.3